MARRRRDRIPDAGKVGRSAVVPYRPGECARKRHKRRLETNLSLRTAVEKWCRANGFVLRITNEGHHWQLARDGFLAEWWPSSAKLVINKQWTRGVHCHDFRQALGVVERAFVEHARMRPTLPLPPAG